MATGEGNDGGRARLAGGAVPGAPPPPAGGGLPDARLAHRGRRRRPGNLAAAQPRPHRHQRGPQPGRLADNAGRARVPGHAARARRAEPLGAHLPDPVVSHQDGDDPEQQALLAEGVGLALLVVLDTLAPAERLAFVLHDMFAVPFEEIGPIVGRSAAAAKMLASRARRRVHGAAVPDADLARQREVVEAFFAAAREGDFAALVALLDPEAVARIDGAARAGISVVRGAAAVAGQVLATGGLARMAQPALVNGAAGVVMTA